MTTYGMKILLNTTTMDVENVGFTSTKTVASYRKKQIDAEHMEFFTPIPVDALKAMCAVIKPEQSN